MSKNTILYIVVLLTIVCSIAITAEQTLVRQDYHVLEQETETQ